MPRPRFPQAARVYDERNEREFRRMVEMSWPEDDTAAEASWDGGFADTFLDADYDGGTA